MTGLIQPTQLDRYHKLVVSFVLYRTEAAEVDRAVRQVLASSELSVHIVIVDNSPVPVEVADFPAHQVTLLRTGKNLGYGRGHNIAIAMSRGRCCYHAVLNTDLAFDAGALPALVDFMDKRPSVGLAMPRITYENGQIQRLCRLLPTPADLIGRRFLSFLPSSERRNRRYEFHDWSYDEVASFPFLSGCFMLIRRSVLDRVQGFDPRYFLYAEDLDLSRRIHAIAETLFVPIVTVRHGYRTQFKRSFRLTRYAMVSLAKYFLKWGWFLDPERDRINKRCLAALASHARQSGRLRDL
jgi:GT2 family glycosyltransferase